MWPCLYPSSWGLRESHGESCDPQRGRLQMCGVYHTKSHRTSGHSPNPPLLPPPTASIAAASTHLIRRNPGAATPFAASCRRLCDRLASIATVASGLGFAMHNNQPEAEAAQWRRQRGISRVDAVPRDTQYLPHPCNGGSAQGGGAVHHDGAALSVS